MKYSKIILSLLVAVLFSCSEDEEKVQQVSSPAFTKSQTSLSNMLSANNAVRINVNPSGIAPLTAELTFNTKSNTSVRIKVLGSIPVEKSFPDISTQHSVPILGLYPDTLNKVEIRIDSDLSYAIDTLEITPDSISSHLPTVEIVTANPMLMEPGMNLNTLSISDGTTFQPYPMMYDYNGDIRWYLNLEGVHPGFVAPMERLDNGNILFETGSSVVEYDMMGYKKKEVMLPSAYHSHHDVIKIPNGNYIVAVDKPSATVLHNGSFVNTVEDFAIEIDGNSGALIKEWDMRAILDVDRDDFVAVRAPLSNDWFHMNAIYYSESDDCLIISGQRQGLVKVDRNNNLKWILAPHKGWGKAGFDGTGPETKPFLLTAINSSGTAYDSLTQEGMVDQSDFNWTWGQHAPLLLPNGNLLVFDNGMNRQFDLTTLYSRAVEYEIDETNKTIKQIWSYGKDRGNDTYSMIISDVDYLPNTGNILFCPGIRFGITDSKIVELTRPGGTVVFEGVLKFKDARATGGGFGQFDLTYRAERLTLYP